MGIQIHLPPKSSLSSDFNHFILKLLENAKFLYVSLKKYWNILISGGGASPADFRLRGCIPRPPAFDAHDICSDSTHKTPRSASTHSQGSCEWFKHNCEVLWVKLEQILQLKVECPNFGPVRELAIYPISLILRETGLCMSSSHLNIVMCYVTQNWNLAHQKLR